MFTNGEHPYFSYIELVSDDGQWSSGGTSVVPILPDGRVIMVVEQRPAQSRFPDRPMIAEVNGQPFNLSQFGPFSSLEFPGGAIDPGEGLRAGFLRELQEETGVEEQLGLYYNRLHPIYHFGGDIAVRVFTGVVYLSGFSYDKQVKTDGGLTVVALTHDDVENNIHNGVIHSGQAALLQWSFYKEVKMLRYDKGYKDKLIKSGYLGVEHIKIAKPPS